jgi:hypothetical protein
MSEMPVIYSFFSLVDCSFNGTTYIVNIVSIITIDSLLFTFTILNYAELALIYS